MEIDKSGGWWWVNFGELGLLKGNTLTFFNTDWLWLFPDNLLHADVGLNCFIFAESYKLCVELIKQRSSVKVGLKRLFQNLTDLFIHPNNLFRKFYPLFNYLKVNLLFYLFTLLTAKLMTCYYVKKYKAEAVNIRSKRINGCDFRGLNFNELWCKKW